MLKPSAPAERSPQNDRRGRRATNEMVVVGALLAGRPPAEVLDAALRDEVARRGWRILAVLAEADESGEREGFAVAHRDSRPPNGLAPGDRILTPEPPRAGGAASIPREALAASDATPLERLLAEDGVRCLVVLPLPAEGCDAGMLVAGRRAPGPLGGAARRALEDLARLSALAVRWRRLETDRQRADEELHRARQVEIAVGRVAQRIAIHRDPDVVMETLAAEASGLGATVLIALTNAAGQALVAFRSLLPAATLNEVREITGIDLRGRCLLPLERLPGYAQLMRDRQLFVSKPRVLLAPLLRRRTRGTLARLAGLLGLDGAHALVVLLSTSERILGIMAMWGPELREGDLPAAAVVASHVTAALDHERLISALTRQRNDLQRMSSRVISAQETERRRLSRELHDQVGQELTALSIDLAAAERALAAGATGAARERLAEAQSLAGQVLERVRELSLDLRPPMLDDLGLAPTLRWYVDGFSRRVGIPVELSTGALETRLPEKVETVLFRVVQEALTNVARHAQASTVFVRLWRDGAGRAVAAIEDDGVGFDVEEAARRPAAEGGGTGLLGIQERALSVGGVLRVESAPGRGTRLTVSIPLGTARAQGDA